MAAVDTYTPGEERANCITHGIGAALSLVGLVLLTTFSCLRGDAWLITGNTIFGVALVALYTASTLYHSFRSLAVKQLLRKFDHAAIFLLIAGSYTPFLLVTLRGPWGWALFGTVWGLAVAGIALKFWFAGRFTLRQRRVGRVEPFEFHPVLRGVEILQRVEIMEMPRLGILVVQARGVGVRQALQPDQQQVFRQGGRRPRLGGIDLPVVLHGNQVGFLRRGAGHAGHGVHCRRENRGGEGEQGENLGSGFHGWGAGRNQARVKV